MNEEKINQILKNQQPIISALGFLLGNIRARADPLGMNVIKSLDECYWETIHLINPQNQKTSVEEMQENTEEHFGEDKFGSRK